MIAALLNLATFVLVGTVGGLVTLLLLVGLPWVTWKLATSAIDEWTSVLPDRPIAVLYAFVAWFTGNMAVILWLAFLDWVLQ